MLNYSTPTLEVVYQGRTITIDAESNIDEMIEALAIELDIEDPNDIKRDDIMIEETWGLPEINDLNDIASYMSELEGIDDHEEAFCKAYDAGYVSTANEFTDMLIGIYGDFIDYAKEIVDQELPDHLSAYFDYDNYSGDLEQDYNLVDLDNGYVAILTA